MAIMAAIEPILALAGRAAVVHGVTKAVSGATQQQAPQQPQPRAQAFGAGYENAEPSV